MPFSIASGPKSLGHISGGDKAHWAAIRVCNINPNIPLVMPMLCAAHCGASCSILYAWRKNEKLKLAKTKRNYWKLPKSENKIDVTKKILFYRLLRWKFWIFLLFICNCKIFWVFRVDELSRIWKYCEIKFSLICLKTDCVKNWANCAN